ncbi:hypothetical protein BIV57_11830, partial [Mangrovactinospora gilvigrisea]
MADALYGPGGFYRAGAGPSGHFRTSVHAAPELFAGAVARLLAEVDERLGRPAELGFVDVGAGRGELAGAVAALLAGTERGARLRAVAVEVGPAADVPGVEWRTELPAPGSVTGLVFANEWLDNVPLEVCERDGGAAEGGAAGGLRYVEVDPETGEESPGGPASARDAAWAARWWPSGRRVEIGRTRDEAWARAVAVLERGTAVAVDYGHLAEERPPRGTLTAFRDGRELTGRPVPDGSCDVTAHVAVDALGGSRVRQREALRELGVSGARPPLGTATRDPRGYVA